MVGSSLNTQEVGVAIQSIGTSIEVRDIARDHFLGASSEVPFGEMDGIGEVNYLTKEVRARAETLDDARDPLAAGACTPVVVGGERVANSFGVFGDNNFSSGL